MKVTPIAEVQPRARRVALGEFDGVHVGHRAVIAGNDTVVTFEPHPRSVITPERAPKLLTSLDLKAEILVGLGVRELVVIPFDERFAFQAPQEFIDTVLIDALTAESVSVGENFHFGHQARGDAAMLAADGRFECQVHPLVIVDGGPVSSSRIRGLLSDGDVAAAAGLLGRPFMIRGEVVPGDQRGRELGFPTANIVPDPQYACPENGVYAGRAGEYLTAINVGVRPTFGSGLRLLVEPYLLDFSGDLYGQTLTLEFAERLRGEARFDDVDELVQQMRADVQRTRQLLASDVA